MKKKYGVVGYKGKIGSLLLERANFVFIDCDVTDLESVERGIGYKEELDVIVNCAAISSIDQCQSEYKRAIEVNVRGLFNLHKVFGERVLNISTDHIWSGNSWWLPEEDTQHSAINSYGLTKMAAEGVSRTCDGKTIRLSRTVSINDLDITAFLFAIGSGFETYTPNFLYRNYTHREHAVDGIEYFVNNYDNMPNVVNYGIENNLNMYDFFKRIAKAWGLDLHLVRPRKDELAGLVPRPRNGGFRVNLAHSLGFPGYNIIDTVSKLKEEKERQNA